MDINKLNPVIENEQINWEKTGERDATDYLHASDQVQDGLIGKLLELAECFSGSPETGHNVDKKGMVHEPVMNPARDAWLKGFGSKLTPTKKSEAKAVFDAYSINQDATETASIEVVGQGVGKASRYNAFIEKCRTIRGKSSRGRQPGDRKLSTAQVKATLENVAKMSMSEAQQALSASVQRVASYKLQDEAVIRQIGLMAESLENNTEDKAVKVFARKVQEHAVALLQRIQEALNEAKTKATEAKESKGIVPTPAMKQEHHDKTEAA